MAAARHYGYVPTGTITSKGRRMGRPPKPKGEQLLFPVQISMTKAQYEAFKKFMASESLDSEAQAGRKIMLDRLKADGFLTD